MRMGPTTSRRALAGAAAVALVVGVVAGCSGGNAKSGPSASTAPSAPTASPSSTPTASPTPDASVKPVRPAVMDQVNAVGAEALAVYFLNLYPYVYASNDLTEWKALSHAECVFCKSVIDNVEKQIAKGERSTGGTLEFTSTTANEVNPGVWYSAELRGQQNPWAVHDANGKLIDEQTVAKNHTFIFALVLQDGAWLVREVQVDDAPK